MESSSSLVMFLLLMCSISSSWPFSCSVFMRKDEAHEVLKVHKHDNYFLEEIRPGNSREWNEEKRSFEEAKEIFHLQEKMMEFWFDCNGLNPCSTNPCDNGGLCKIRHYNYFCICPPKFGGDNCEKEKFECWCKNGGCWQSRRDNSSTFRVERFCMKTRRDACKQGFKNSPTLFGEQLVKDLESWEAPQEEGKPLQDVDDLLIATRTKEACVAWTRFLKYQAIMAEQDDVEIVVTNIVNPASFLSGNQGEPVYHDCLETTEATYSSRPDLKDTPFG
ncbi:LOW QUALITY PROTEIN: coagulation factor VII-like [Pterocles gutturalis]